MDLGGRHVHAPSWASSVHHWCTLTTFPDTGFNVEKVQYKNVVFTVWDVGGQEKLRPLWKHYFNNTDALIFVLDAADRDRLKNAAEEFKVLLKLCDASGIVSQATLQFCLQ